MSEIQCILGIDAGTTSIAGVLVDSEGGIRAEAYSEFPQYFPRPGWVEQDAEEIWQTVRRVAAQVIERAPDVDVAAIGIANQRETVIVWDRRSGKPIHRAVVWQCRRTAEDCARLKEAGEQERVRAKTGLVIDPYFSATKLAWVLDHVDGAREAADSLAFGTVDTWLIRQLSGGAAHVTDFSNASRTMLFDIDRREWDDELLDLFRVPRTIMPSVLPSASEFGCTRGLGFLPDGIPISGVAGDQQAALFGHLGFETGIAKNTYGTGCFLLTNAGGERPASRHGLLTTLACAPDGSPAYALEGSIFTTGAVVQWLRDDLGVIESAADSEAAATSVPDAGGVVFVPALSGLGAPFWDPDARGTIFGVTRGTTRAHIVRAALEGIAHRTADVVEAMEEDVGTKLRALRVDGGAAANDFLMQCQSNVLGVPVERPRQIETTVLGAVYLAGIQTRVWSPGDLKGVYGVERRFTPGIDEDARLALRGSWRQCIERLVHA